MPKKLFQLFILFGFFILKVIFAHADKEGKLSITTYFPAPYGSYKELTTARDTSLATADGKVVGIGIDVGAIAPKTLLQVGTSPSAGLLVRTSGNIGIGTTNPGGYRLRVEGNMTVTGKLNVPGSDAEVNAVPGWSGIIGVSRPVTLTSCRISVVNGVVQSLGTDCL
ncbi:MAG: hypothetical protein NT033_03230 [Candidatus Omnitrophica bacterium]|nr:hypothetical protein [Candidatus Omnitrophota bacterium]